MAKAKPKPKPTLLVNRSEGPLEDPEHEIASKPVWHDEPPLAAVAAPPPRPVAVRAAGPTAPFGTELLFVPDFSGQTMARARRVAATESLVITTSGAIEGWVVSQRPVPGTLLEGDDRTVRLRFSPSRKEG